MGKPISNGLVSINGKSPEERGFNCMKLICFLVDDGVMSHDDWHGAHLEAAGGKCRYKARCPIYARTIRKYGEEKYRQMTLFDNPNFVDYDTGRNEEI